MKPDGDALDALAESVSDDRPIDWSAAGWDFGGERERASLRALRDLSRIAEFNRRIQRAPADPPASPAPWGELLVLEPLGSGAHGQVWRCWDPRLRREVALKWLQAEPGDAAGALLAEARALARVRAPGVVTVHGIDEREGRLGMWMELLHGESLAQAIERRGSLPPAEVARIGGALARALEAVHQADLVHRDIKPANVMIEPEGRVVLTDFGLGQRCEIAEGPLDRASGTPLFMSPERLRGLPATRRSDLYAVGVTLWCALAGRPPFTAQTLAELREQAEKGPATPLGTQRPDAPPALVRAIERAMAPAEEARCASAAQLADQLESAAAPIAARGARAPAARPALAIVAIALAAAGIAALALLRPAPRAPVSAAGGTPPPAAPAVPATYDVEASLLRRSGGGEQRLADGDRVRPGDRLSLEFRASRRAWVYVLNEDERGESFLLFPGPSLDLRNPIAASTEVILPGPVGGRENAWTVTSRGGREHFLVVASPEPVPEIEAELDRLPRAAQGRAVRYARLDPAATERLRGVGGIEPLADGAAPRRAGTLARFARLAGRETGVHGVWVRELSLENPLR